ncbi:MAG: rod shape-determining protein MreD [Clostridiaceae bacterium]|jgi:rod shape-determining protein MreD|nr:rod shape-determining protein MreD [Clostridiaceae bacterium]
MIAKRKGVLKYKILINAVNIIIILLLQTTLVDYMGIKNVKPNFILVYIVCASIMEGSVGGGWIGLFAGLTYDILCGKYLGFFALLGMYTGIIAGMANRRVHKENVIVALFFNFFLTIFYELGVYIISNLGQRITNILYVFRNILLVEALYNTGLSIIVHILVVRIYRKLNLSK